MKNRNFLRLFLASLSMGVLLLAIGCSSTDDSTVEVTGDAVVEESAPVETEVVTPAEVEKAFEGMTEAEVEAAFEAEGWTETSQ